jgi:heme A synthase
MRTAYRVLAYLLAATVAAQAALIAFGAFALENKIDKGPVSDGDTTGVTLHHVGANAVILCAVVLLGISFRAKIDHGVRWAAILLALVVLQFMLAYTAYGTAIVGALHGVNALAIFAVSLQAGRRVSKTAPADEAPARDETKV